MSERQEKKKRYNLRLMWIADAQRMEDACSRLANRQDIWQDRIVYWICVAVLHLLQNEIRRYGKRTM